MTPKTVFISADHGLAIVYFLQSDVVPTMIESGVEVVLLTDEALLDKIQEKFGRAGLVIESLRLKQARAYFQNERNSQQWWLDFFRRAGAASRMNLETVDNYVNWVKTEAPAKRKAIFPAVHGAIAVLRRWQRARQALVLRQHEFTPDIYGDLYKRYKPDLVVASTAGWRMDRYLLREARARSVRTAAIVLGWDNPSSHGLPGSKIDTISCWSEPQKQELILGSDWAPERINIGGIPIYDGYFHKQWLMPRDEYFRLHGLDRIASCSATLAALSPTLPTSRISRHWRAW